MKYDNSKTGVVYKHEVDDVYNQLVLEMMQKNQDPGAESYFLDGGVERTIDETRYQRIREIFFEVNNHQLSPTNLITHLAGRTHQSKWKPLEAAVIRFVDENQINKSAFGEIYRYVQDGETKNSNTAEIASQFFKVMEEQFGYSKEATLEAMRFVRQYENKALRQRQARNKQ